MHNGDEEFDSSIGFGMNDAHVGINRVLAITFVNLLIARLEDEEICSNAEFGEYRYGLKTKI